MSKESFLNFSSKKSQMSLDYKAHSEILKQLEILDEENLQLKEALTDLEKDLKEKDQSIEESQRIITKLKDEYSKVIKEFQQMEKSYNELLNEFNEKTIEINNTIKTELMLNDLKKRNNTLSAEKNCLYKENVLMRKKIMSCGNISFRNEIHIKNKDFIIEDLQKKNKNYLRMIKERENTIEEKNKKIKELNDVIDNKNEELKIMMNFSKEINKKNKANVKELTNQAVKTLKIFQNNIEKKRTRNHSADYNTKISLTYSQTTFEDFEFIFKNNKASFSLEEAINSVMMSDNLNSISKEFLMNFNFKTELIKNELFSGLIRERHFVNFLKSIFDKLNLRDIQNMYEFKKKYMSLLKENHKLKIINKDLIAINNKYNSDINSIKQAIMNNNNTIKNKIMSLIKDIKIDKDINQKKVQKLKNEIKGLNGILIRNNIQNDSLIKKFLYTTNKNQNKNDYQKKISFQAIFSPRNWNTLPTWDATDISEIKMNSTSREISDKNQSIRINKDKNKIYHKKANKIKTKKIMEDMHYDNSIDKIENSIPQNKTYSNIRIKDEYKYKKDICNLQKEINNILMKSTISGKNINLKDSRGKNHKQKFCPFNKINSYMIKKKYQKNEKEIFTERMHYKKIEIPELKFHNFSQYSQMIQKDNILMDDNNNDNNIFSYNYFINLILKMNENIFDLLELRKYKETYNFSNVDDIYTYFKETCDELKNKTDEISLKINKSHYLTGTNFTERINLNNHRKDYLDNSFKLFNERIISLKKFEFEFINMSEYIKNYLIAQETTIDIMSDKGKKYIKFEPIERLFNLFEQCLNYRIDEMEKNIIFSRKLLIKVFKNQINCLFLSFEYNNINYNY